MKDHESYPAYVARKCRAAKYSATYTRFWLAHLRCPLCGLWSTAPHHIRTRAAGGDDHAINLLPLCATHHAEIHQLGVRGFSERYPGVACAIETALDRSRVTGV
jgi:hypothetical protein